MNSSKSSRKRASKISYKQVSPFDLYFQLTYMSAMASAGIPRNKLFELAAMSAVTAGAYFEGINTLVDEMRFDYPEACRKIGLDSKSENMKTFLLRMSDALRSGEPMADFLSREAEAMGEDYENRYERDLESLKQWANAFSSIVISVSLIVIIQVISAMISSLNIPMMTGLVSSGAAMAGFGTWIIYRSAPAEKITMPASKGAPEQKLAMRVFRMVLPISAMIIAVMALLGVPTGYILIILSAVMLPIGIISLKSDGKTNKKDIEFSTFLRSIGGMATSSGTTLRESLTYMDLSSFPTLEPDIERLSKRLKALIDPEVCWTKFGQETGSRLISDIVKIFYGGVKIGGDPERVGYLCSLFTSKTAQLRAKRRLNASTFAGLTIIMHAVMAGLMVFVLSIVTQFATLVAELLPSGDALREGQANFSMGMANFSPEDLQFLGLITLIMILAMAMMSSLAVLFSDGGYRLKIFFYIALTIFISGVSLIAVPPMVAGILTI